MFFFFKQKTAYEIKECDWSSDVCSSDLKLSNVRDYQDPETRCKSIWEAYFSEAGTLKGYAPAALFDSDVVQAQRRARREKKRRKELEAMELRCDVKLFSDDADTAEIEGDLETRLDEARRNGYFLAVVGKAKNEKGDLAALGEPDHNVGGFFVVEFDGKKKETSFILQCPSQTFGQKSDPDQNRIISKNRNLLTKLLKQVDGIEWAGRPTQHD